MSKSNFKMMLLTASAIAVTWAWQSAAQAAEASGGAAPAASSTNDSNASTELQEVVVTAEKRVTDVQHTAAAVRPIRPDELVRSGVDELSEISKVAPDVSITRVNQGAVVDIRGVESQANNPTAESAVAVLVDGADLPKQQALQGFLFDLSQVEVLKGPQGTLYGRDSNGGAVNIITNPPNVSGYSAQAQLEVGNYDLVRVEGDLNLPLSDKVALRVAFQTQSHAGYMQSGLDDENEQAVRVSLLAEPASNQTLKIVADYSHDNSLQDLAVFNITKVQPGVTNVYVPANPRDDTFYDGTAGNSPYSRGFNQVGVTAQYDYRFNGMTWTTIASFRNYAGNTVAPANLGSGPSEVAPNGDSSLSGERSVVTLDDTSYSLETRLASDSSTPLQWLVGAYLFSDIDNGYQAGYAGSSATAYPTPQVQFGNGHELARTAALFGQVTWTPTFLNRLHLTVGGRLNVDDKQDSDIYTDNWSVSKTGVYTEDPVWTAGAGEALPVGTPVSFLLPQANATFRSATYKAGASYDLSSQSMIYASVSTGFKAGGFGYGPGLNPEVGPIFVPETITAYEIGAKNRFLDNRLQINLEAWYYDYHDFQTNVVMYTCGPSPVPHSTNVLCAQPPIITNDSAGRATYKGLTLSSEFKITRDDLIQGQFTLETAEYGSYVIPGTPTGYSLVPGQYSSYQAASQASINLTGTGVPNVPRSSGVATYTHTFRDVLDGAIDFQGHLQYRGRDLMDVAQDSIYGRVVDTDHAWAMGDLSVRYVPDNDRWNITLYVHNVTDGLHPVAERYLPTVHAWSEAFFAPRTFGAILTAKF
jgi:iron complex outermembrane receptor protein